MSWRSAGIYVLESARLVCTAGSPMASVKRDKRWRSTGEGIMGKYQVDVEIWRKEVGEKLTLNIRTRR